MYGLSAAHFVAVVDSHYVTSETLQAFSPIVDQVLGLSNVKMSEIHKAPGFKEVLKEVNNRSHNIYNWSSPIPKADSVYFIYL